MNISSPRLILLNVFVDVVVYAFWNFIRKIILVKDILRWIQREEQVAHCSHQLCCHLIKRDLNSATTSNRESYIERHIVTFVFPNRHIL